MKEIFLKEIRKYVDCNKERCFYFSKRISLSETNSFLKEIFPDEIYNKDFLFGLYNSLRFFKEIDETELINYVKKIKDLNNKSYFVPNEKYYGEKPHYNDFWENYIITIVPVRMINNSEDYIALSKIKEYEYEHPSCYCLNGLFNMADKKTTAFLFQEKLLFEPETDMEIDYFG